MKFDSLVASLLESSSTWNGLNIEIKIRSNTKSKVWKEIADVRINGEKKGIFGTNEGFENFQCTGYNLGFDIPGVGNDSLDPKRRELLKHLLVLVRDEYNKHRYMKHGASEEEAVTIFKI